MGQRESRGAYKVRLEGDSARRVSSDCAAAKLVSQSAHEVPDRLLRTRKFVRDSLPRHGNFGGLKQQFEQLFFRHGELNYGSIAEFDTPRPLEIRRPGVELLASWPLHARHRIGDANT